MQGMAGMTGMTGVNEMQPDVCLYSVRIHPPRPADQAAGVVLAGEVLPEAVGHASLTPDMHFEPSSLEFNGIGSGRYIRRCPPPRAWRLVLATS